MQGFLVGLILGAGAALGGLYYYGSFEVMDKEFGRSAGNDDYTMEETVVVEDAADAMADEADAAAEDVVEDVADEAGDMADVVEGAAEDVADDAGDMADVVEDAVEEEDSE